MTRSCLDRAVARATGESLSTIRRLGFSLATPARVARDPEPSFPPRMIDWDELDTQRVSYVPQRQPALA